MTWGTWRRRRNPGDLRCPVSLSLSAQVELMSISAESTLDSTFSGTRPQTPLNDLNPPSCLPVTLEPMNSILDVSGVIGSASAPLGSARATVALVAGELGNRCWCAAVGEGTLLGQTPWRERHRRRGCRSPRCSPGRPARPVPRKRSENLPSSCGVPLRFFLLSFEIDEAIPAVTARAGCSARPVTLYSVQPARREGKDSASSRSGMHGVARACSGTRNSWV